MSVLRGILCPESRTSSRNIVLPKKPLDCNGGNIVLVGNTLGCFPGQIERLDFFYRKIVKIVMLFSSRVVSLCRFFCLWAECVFSNLNPGGLEAVGYGGTSHTVKFSDLNLIQSAFIKGNDSFGSLKWYCHNDIISLRRSNDNN